MLALGRRELQMELGQPPEDEGGDVVEPPGPGLAGALTHKGSTMNNTIHQDSR